MSFYMLVDFGSTYTKISLIDIENGRLFERVNAHTSVKEGVDKGFEEALKKLDEKVNLKNLEIKEVLACSSAYGGLKMVGIGITPQYTTEAAKRALVGAGAKLVKAYNYYLKERDIEEIEKSNPDIILLTGGADGGNKDYIIENAKKLSKIKNIPLVIAGNSSAKGEIENILKNSNSNYIFAENVMPDVNRFTPEDAKEKIREIFMEKITHAKGMDKIKVIKDRVLMPTPTAVLKAAELMAMGTEKYEGFGDLIVVDIGGATTDIHSVSEPYKLESNILEGLRESFLKRTVEGDMGMRYSAYSVFENYREGFLSYNYTEEEIIKKCMVRQDNPEIIFQDEKELEFDKLIAENCVRVSINRHAGSVRRGYLNGHYIDFQDGKDLRFVKNVIGTGGVIINNKNPKEILEKIKDGEENKLTPENPSYFIDEKYILSHIGLLSTIDKDLAFKVLSENLKEVK